MKGKYKRNKKGKNTPPQTNLAGSMDAGEKQKHAREKDGKTETCNSENNVNSLSKWWHEPAHVIQSVGIAIGTIVALIYLGQLCEMKEANRINRESLESIQRAFIAYDHIETTRGKSGQRIYWNIHPFYQNDGSTPALNAVNNWVMTEGAADAKNIPEDLFKAGKTGIKTATPTTIAPKAIQGVFSDSVDETFMFGIDLGDNFENFAKATPRSDLIIVGWMVYSDVMPKTNRHLTEFCRHFDSLTLTAESHPTIKFNFTNCATHNCTDEYCPDYSEVMKYAKEQSGN